MQVDCRLRAQGRSVLVADSSLAGQDLRDRADWDRSVEHGLLVPFALNEKFPVGLRVIDRELTAAEDRAWLGRLRCNATFPSGRILIAGGLYELAHPEDEEEESVWVDVPGGDHQVAIHTLVTGVNARWCLMRADGVGWDGQEMFGAWFRRTRPTEAFPEWLRTLCMLSPDTDPGHENEWAEHWQDDLNHRWEERPWVDYIIQILAPDADLDRPPLDGGLMVETEVRRLIACPDAALRE